jgi:hypothetical protein
MANYLSRYRALKEIERCTARRAHQGYMKSLRRRSDDQEELRSLRSRLEEAIGQFMVRLICPPLIKSIQADILTAQISDPGAG